MDGSPAVGEARERMALVLAEVGMQRMAARVLSAFLFAETETSTMGDLADELGVSAGAMSGAVRVLTSLDLLERVPVPSSRRDHYRLRPDPWTTMFDSEQRILGSVRDLAGRSLDLVAPGSPAARRLSDLCEFYGFLLEELPALLRRWTERRASTGADR